MSDDLGDAATRLYLEVQKARARIESLQSELATVKAERDARAKETEMLLVGCRATNKQLNIELAAVRRDAERYGWLRDCQTGSYDDPAAFKDTGGGEGYPRLEGAELDAAIDAALASQPEGSQVAAGADGTCTLPYKGWCCGKQTPCAFANGDYALPPKEGGAS